jgi:retinol dehydrogenase 12
MGGALSIAQQSFPPRPTWGVDDIPDLTGKVAIVTGTFINLGVCSYANIVTGGNVGVGKETVKVRFARHREALNLAYTLYRRF